MFLSFLYLEKFIRLSININTENNVFVLILFAPVMSIPFCRITKSCPMFDGIKYTFDFADKRTGKKSDAKNTGWLTRGGRTSS